MGSTSTKRPHEATASSDDDHDGARQDSPKRPRHKYNKGSSVRGERNKTGLSINELKTKIRDAKRLLARDSIPADVRIEKERAILGYQRDLEQAQLKKKRNHMIGKYHFVRFMERKKAIRALKYLRTEKSILQNQENPPTERLAQLEEQISTARIDLNYTKYSPLTEKYVSLYPNDKGKKEKKEEDMTEEEQEAKKKALLKVSASREKPPLWYAVEKSMEEGTLDLLREGKLGIRHDGKKRNEGTAAGIPMREKKEKSKAAVTTSKGVTKSGRKADEGRDSKKKRGTRNSAPVDEDRGSDDESDGGGFFEI